MAESEVEVLSYRNGDILMWRVSANYVGDAKAAALRMGALADCLGLGSWNVAEIGLGGAYWFDLVLAKEVDEIFVLLTFDRRPDLIY